MVRDLESQPTKEQLIQELAKAERDYAHNTKAMKIDMAVWIGSWFIAFPMALAAWGRSVPFIDANVTNLLQGLDITAPIFTGWFALGMGMARARSGLNYRLEDALDRVEEYKLASIDRHIITHPNDKKGKRC